MEANDSKSIELEVLIKDVKFAMLTTVGRDGHLHSRPLTTREVAVDDAIWFLVRRDSELAENISSEQKVNLSYADPDDQRFVSISGTAQILNDPAKARALWTPAARVWFQGPEDADLAILRVGIYEVDYWNAPSNRFERVMGFMQAMATGDERAVGRHEHFVNPAPDEST